MSARREVLHYFALKRIQTLKGQKELLNFLFPCASGYAGSVARAKLEHIEPQLAYTIQGCNRFDSFSLDNPENHSAF